jgi:hypothetical protein
MPFSITLGLFYSPGHPEHYGRIAWPGFAVACGTNVLGLLVILMRRDIVWAVAATWICTSMWSARPKPAPVYVSRIHVCTIFHH